MTSADRPAFETTAIGSLPHHNVDAALQFSLRTQIPFLPQIPIRNPWEFMLAQALEGLPGIQVESDGMVGLNLDVWQSRSDELGDLLAQAFSQSSTDTEAFSAFEPSPAISSSWQPFVWELEEREFKRAKVQIAGPLTCQWSLRTFSKNQKNSSLAQRPEIATQIYRLVLARALAMTRRIQASGITPLLYLDEPGLYGLVATDPKHVLGVQELKIMIQTLRKEGVEVGLHCCSNTDWNTVLGLGLNVLSIDASLSLKSLLSTERAPLIEQFVQQGGRLSLGIIPTARSSVLQSLDVETLFSELLSSFAPWKDRPDFVTQVISQAIYTPACGLALHSVADAERILELLTSFVDFCRETLRKS